MTGPPGSMAYAGAALSTKDPATTVSAAPVAPARRRTQVRVFTCSSSGVVQEQDCGTQARPKVQTPAGHRRTPDTNDTGASPPSFTYAVPRREPDTAGCGYESDSRIAEGLPKVRRSSPIDTARSGPDRPGQPSSRVDQFMSNDARRTASRPGLLAIGLTAAMAGSLAGPVAPAAASVPGIEMVTIPSFPTPTTRRPPSSAQKERR